MRRRQKPPAIADLAADWLVFRRHAAHRIGDRRIDQLQAVVGPRFERAARKDRIRISVL